MTIRAKVLGRGKTLALLRGIVPEAEKELAKTQLEEAQRLAKKIKPRAPRQTGSYQASIVGDRLAERPGQRAVTGGLPNETKDPNATGIFAEYIWRFLEFGTVKMAKRPHIFPTYRQEKPRIRRKMAASVRKAVKKVKT